MIFFIRIFFYIKMSVSIRREISSTKSYTVIIFDNSHIYKWPTNNYEHNQIKKLYMQDKLHEGIINDYSKWKKLLN